MTLKEVKESGIKVWEYIIEHKLLKNPVDVFPELRQYNSGYAACDYTYNQVTQKDILSNACYEFCPIIEAIGRCDGNGDNAYHTWHRATEWTEEAEQAARRILKAHQDMEVEE